MIMGMANTRRFATAIIGISLFVVGVMICYSGVTKTYRAICGETLQQPGVVALIAAIVKYRDEGNGLISLR